MFWREPSMIEHNQPKNQTFLPPNSFLSTIMWPIILTIFFFSRVSSVSDQCSPTNCTNGPPIRSPFFVTGQSDCGVIRLDCAAQGFPTLSLSGNLYVIDEIFYGNASLHLRNADYYSSLSQPNCVPRLPRSIGNNISLPSYRSARLEIVASTYLHLFSECILPSYPLQNNQYGCSLVPDCWDYAVPDGDLEGWTYLARNCGMHVVAPVEGGDGGIVKAVGLLQRGFLLSWHCDSTSCGKGNKKKKLRIVIILAASK
ncbi:hypothetical protein M569_12489 [Genlisea aurea]|uniref:Wall-associated receptor kinase galacturonan-binding domain-containing protein n=1 Tax=Genlisea aurea TaxID=192259 RepID=S8DHJ1_9LAMI|nr:hypothetical protein M569_12489 [Genlisea aurea]